MSPRRDETKPFLRKGLTLQLSPCVSETPNGIVYAMTLSTEEDANGGHRGHL